MAKTGRSRCKTCRHPARDIIDAAIVGGASDRVIARQFGIGRQSVQRHRQTHVPQLVAQAIEARSLDVGEDVYKQIRRAMSRINALLDACHRWLQSPEDPHVYDLDPRTEEVSVIFYDASSGKPVRKKKPLSTLLAQLQGGLPISVDSWHWRYADPRRLILEAARELHRYVETVGKITGQLQSVTMEAAVTEAWRQLRPQLLEALRPFPEVRLQLATVLEQMEAA